MNAVTHIGDSGLSQGEAAERLQRYGRNALPEPKAPTLVVVFLHQFLSPLIYILLVAAIVSAAISDVEDAIFIGIVLLVNGVIGTVQEYSAGRAAVALRRLEQPHASVLRDGVRREIDAREIVPGDVVLLEAGGRVPADLRLLASDDLRCDESPPDWRVPRRSRKAQLRSTDRIAAARRLMLAPWLRGGAVAA